MKKIVGFVLFALMMLMAIPAQSQIRFGLKGGVNISLSILRICQRI